MHQTTRTNQPFDIRVWIEHDKSGRAPCPCCIQDGKTKQKNLSIDLSTGAYHCWRGCTSEQIREVLGVSKGVSSSHSPSLQQQSSQSISTQPHTVPQKQVYQSQQRLLDGVGKPQERALAWLESRGFTREMIAHYHLGLEQKWLTFDENNPHVRECYWSVTIYIPADEAGQFYKKLRIAPWLTGEDRPDDLPKWSQYGVPATVFYTYRPDSAEATWCCEGEWDAMRLGWLARQLNAKVAVCCSTAGCGTVPRQEQLDGLPGRVIIFFDRNDKPTKDGSIPGDEGARKLALALGDRGRIARVPMPEGCEVQGWDVSNALDAGFTWADFQMAATAAALPQTEPQPTAAQSPHGSPAQTLRERLLEVLHQHESPFLREIALMTLARETGYSYREMEGLAKSLATEVDFQFDRDEAASSLQNLLKTRRTQLDLKRYLEPWFAETMIETARAMPTAPEFLFTTLLAAAASRVGTAARVVIKPSAKYTQPMVFWSAIVANSGSMKTPAQRVVLDPLISLEKEAYEVYQLELADYKAAEAQKGKKQNGTEDEATLQPPIRRRHLTKDSTLETLQRIHAENPRGLLYYRDELAGAVKVRNQYRGGHGADEEAELDQWVGSAVIVDRAEKSICLPQSAISRTGAIQWEVLAALMGDHQDVNGAWSRWLFCAAEAPPRYLRLLQEDPDTGISEALTFLYTELERIPQQDYLLSFAAKQLFETWQHQLVDAQSSEDAFGLQLVYPKIESYTARLALWLHIVNAVLRGEQPSQVISGETMEKAIELAAYYLWQHRSIHTHNSPDSGLAAVGLKIQKFAERVGEVTASKLKSGVRALRKMATDQIRQLMQTLAQAGYGQVMGEGVEMVYVSSPLPRKSSAPITDEVDTLDHQLTATSIVEVQANRDLQTPVDTIDNLPVLSREAATAVEGVEADSPTELAKSPSLERQVSSSNAEQPLLSLHLELECPKNSIAEDLPVALASGSETSIVEEHCTNSLQVVHSDSPTTLATDQSPAGDVELPLVQTDCTPKCSLASEEQAQVAQNPWYVARLRPRVEEVAPFTKGQRVIYQEVEYVVRASTHTHTQLEGIPHAIANWQLKVST